MRDILAMLLCVVCLQGKAQLLNPASDWFEATSFFNAATLIDHKITDIHVLIVNKKDGEIIIDRGDFLHYTFAADGKLEKFFKSIKLSGSIDTATVSYRYNAKNQVIERREKQGPFHYLFVYEYEDGLPKRAIKIDERAAANDTLYNRLLESEEYPNKQIIKTLNNKGLPYKTRTKIFKAGNLIEESIQYSRNQNFSRVKYFYQQGMLKRSVSHRFFNREKKKEWQFEYEGKYLKFAKSFENNKRIKKRAFTFREDNLIDAIIERDYVEKSIRIYRFLYRFDKAE